MGDGSVAGAVIMGVCCFGCATIFLGIGLWARKAQKPVNFWSGTTVPAEKVMDVKSYNCANAVLWEVYSIPFWVAGVFGVFGFLGDIFLIVAAIILFVACGPGGLLLVRQYQRIEKMYIKK